ncbi:MAG: hypothetical protein GY913_16255 [Proteobacteria bacterium]|nr:hypothetical protein [Pseudomonadota bacterium]MCP4918458.1 hypothetical protein [Pseudomonadota bacterium]
MSTPEDDPSWSNETGPPCTHGLDQDGPWRVDRGEDKAIVGCKLLAGGGALERGAIQFGRPTFQALIPGECPFSRPDSWGACPCFRDG